MTNTQPRTFFGVPISGDKTRGVEPRAPQRPAEELAPLLQAVLDDPLISECGWRQYTPYFNDGEPCEFSTHGTWFRTTKDKASSERCETCPDCERPAGDNDFCGGCGCSLILDRDEPDHYELELGGYGTSHPTLGKIVTEWDLKYEREGTPEGAQVGQYVGEHEDSYRTCVELGIAIENGTFYDVLLEHFGDHAEVTVSASGIQIDFYEHD